MKEIKYEDLSPAELGDLISQRLQEISQQARKKYKSESRQMKYIVDTMNSEFGSCFEFQVQKKE